MGRIRSNVSQHEDSFLQQLINTRLAKSRENPRSMLGAERLLNTALKTDYSNPHVSFKNKRSSTAMQDSTDAMRSRTLENAEQTDRIARISLFDKKTWELAAMRLGRDNASDNGTIQHTK